MATATLVAEPGFYSGPAKAFRVDPALRDPLTRKVTDHVVVVKTTLGGPRIEVFACNSRGIATRMNPLPGSQILQHDVTIDDACAWALMTAGGYEIVEEGDDSN